MKIVTILTEGYADWETALLNAVAHGYYGVETLFASPGGHAVTSAAGLRVSPGIAIEDIEVSNFDALVLNGGTAWSQPDAPDLAGLLRRATERDILVAGICDATKALALAGVLDTRAHTSNSAETLTATGYAGASHFRDQPAAVRDGRIVTAPGTAPVTFMVETLAALGLRNSDLDFYTGLHAAEHAAPA